MKAIYIVFFSVLISTFTLAQSPAYPVLTGIVIDACNTYTSTPACASTFDNSNCSEGRSEVAFFRAGTTAITAATVQSMTSQVIKFYTTPWSTLQYYSGISMNNTAATTALNTNGCTGSCGTCFYNAWSTGIPAGATFIMLADYFCVGTTDFTSLCASATSSPIYVIYFGASTNNSTNCNGGTTGQWNASGNYTNYGSSATKGIAISMSSLVAGAPTLYYQYDINDLTNCSGASDGGGVGFPMGSTTTGGAVSPNAYTSCACNLPIVLPVNLLNFTATKTTEGTKLNWTTVSESNNDYFDVQYSLDAQNFIYYTKIKGAGNSNSKINYSCIFNENVGDNKVYFRLKQVDFNGNYKYSTVITLGNYPSTKSNLIAYYNTEKDKIVTHFHLDFPQQVNISLYDVTGAKVQETSPVLYQEGDNEVLLNTPDKAGIYIFVYQAADGLIIHKKVIVK
ncbi:MAG TPA: T9SS type A sorting domain-containing protein [Bacteroidia bacterium]|nr:T9SS type A sorting domain-containing protein [Bacteroidia bacterium]